ncbi:MAG: transcriptional coactivator p15/PC4 family protein [Anaerolineales bacterium]|nr:transcriptional coactivator p15/PC4 family protein [Anaerolineales bacterium]
MEEEIKGTIIAQFPKNNREMICVGRSEFQGKQLVFVRTYAAGLEDEELVPTPSGVSLAAELTNELVQGVQALKDALKTEGVVAKIKKNSKQEVWIGMSIFKERPLIYIRTYAVWGDDPEFKPTKKGISVSTELYPQLLEVVQKLTT